MFEELRAFILFGEEGSIQKVAQRLPLTQPAVSRQIQRLEQALGLTLLDRRQKPPAITPIGAAVLARGRDILDAVEEMKALDRSREPEGVFRLGLVNGLSHARLAEALVAAMGRFPSVSLRLKSGWSSDLAEQHRLGHLDVAVILSDGSRLDDAEQIGTERLIAIGANRPAVPPAGAGRGWVLSPEGCDARHALAARLAQSNRPMIIAAEVEHPGLQMGLVREGIGLGLIPKRLLEREPPQGVTEIDAFGGELRFDVLMLRSPHLGALRKVADAIAEEVRQFMAVEQA